MKLGLSSASVFSAPPIYLQPAIKGSSLLFPRSYVGGRNNNYHAQSVAICKSNKFKVCCSQLKVEEEGISDETCELVNGTELTIGDGIRAYLCTAVKNNNATGILLLSDIFGFEDDSTRDFAYRVACNGYNVLVPDLFKGDPWSKERPKASFEEWIKNQKDESVTRVFASAKWMRSEFADAGLTNKLGIIGFCFGGGRLIDVLSQDNEGCFGSGVSFYGTRIDPSAASDVKVPVLLITGDGDALCPVDALEEIVKRNSKLMKMVVFKGKGHGFVHRPQSNEEDEAAEEAFTLMRNWLSGGLLLKN